jgi:glycosyltransferase involved in cell wall biosynthesis
MISVVIPALNEEDSIATTVKQITEMIAASGYENGEVIVVDDGSSDQTRCRAESGGAQVVSHPQNVGYGRSLKDGIRAASNDIVVIIDADSTYPVSAIPELVEERGKGFDMVVGARTGNVYQGPALKRALRQFLKFLVEFTTGRSIPDVNSGLRVFSRSEVTPYFAHLSDGFSFTTSLTLAYMMTGKFVQYVPISYNRRTGTTKVRLVRDGLRTLQFIVEAILYYNPIKIYILMSAACVAAGAAGLVLGLALRSGVWLGFGIAAILLSVLVFSIGLLAVLLKRILDK